MKATIIVIPFALLLGGCASNIVPMGSDTFMVEHGGWPHLNQFKMEAQCLQDANRYCEKRGLSMVVVSVTDNPGKELMNNASAKLVFKAVPKNGR